MQSLQVTHHPEPNHSWRISVSKYENPAAWRSLWQLINSVGSYVAVFGLMYFSLGISYWLTLALAIPAAGFMTRSFIILHDCGHGSFFKSQRINNILGTILGIITFTPFYYWRHDHAIHHATSGDLDRREVGDIWTMTVSEYLQSPRFRRLTYRFYRNPLVMFGIGPFYIFLISYRFPRLAAKSRERKSIYITNLGILGIMSLVGFTIGLKAYILVQLPIILIALPIGVWLFYVQHQYEGVYWERNDDWDYVTAALQGSSFYKLPRFLQWFSGNIGYHHIHH
ncbi:MAG: fatty acid desaturase, partial [bacterium]